ncbi:MAG: carboxylating nicotinate-nucleotide diphosphorylase [Actinomycetota bacterium]|nr:carboxylating nicotinate-nucleotide diphosphorylase [Actinomycetota bacterium]
MSSLPPNTDTLLQHAITEDLGLAGDLTSQMTIPDDARSTAKIVARAPGRISGLSAALRVFELVDPTLAIQRTSSDGVDTTTGDTLAIVHGSTRSILSAERVALNLLGHLSGVATATRMLVEAIEDTGVRVMDTRKTTPGLRALEKAAVRDGGGANHRFGLFDAVMIKDNHLAAIGSVTEAVARARDGVGHTVTIEVEASTVHQASDAAAAGADIVLLDNMDPATTRAAVEAISGRCIVEASGGITVETIRSIAETGVDVISVGWITHSAPSLDVALDLESH